MLSNNHFRYRLRDRHRLDFDLDLREDMTKATKDA